MYPDTGSITTLSYKTTRRVLDVFRSQKFYDNAGNKAPKHIGFGVDISGSGSIQIGEPRIQSHGRVFRPLWLVAHVLVRQEPSKGLPEDPLAQAEKDIHTLLLKRRLGIKELLSTTEAQEKVIAKLEELLKKYRLLLEDATKEQELQGFIETNSIFLVPFSQSEDVHPKYKLGKEYVTDFLIENKPPMPFSHTFVEIEPASEPLFLKTTGRETDLTARTNHAIEQLRDWQVWIRDNIAYIKADFPNLDQCNYILISGRSDRLTTIQKRKLAELNAEHNWRMMFTYDDLADRLDQLITKLKKI